MMVRPDVAGVRLLTRNGIDWTTRFPLIAAAAAALRVKYFLIDGEVVCCDGDRTTPRLGIAQRTFDRELSPIFIDEDQKMPRLAHRPKSSSASRFTAGAAGC